MKGQKKGSEEEKSMMFCTGNLGESMGPQQLTAAGVDLVLILSFASSRTQAS